MTVATTGNKFSYAGDGVTVAFSFPRLFMSDGDLKVILRDAGSVEIVQTLATHYTLAGAGNPAGGTVTMVVPPAAGETLVLVRRTALKQETDYTTGGVFSAEGHESALDELTLMVQDLDEKIDRAPQLKETTAASTPEFPEPEASKLIRWNAAATALESVFVGALGAIGITVTTDNRMMKSDGTAGNLQETGITVDDSDNVSGVNDLTVGGAFTSTGLDDNATGEVAQFADTVAQFGKTGATYILSHRDADQIFVVGMGAGGVSGMNLLLYGSGHANANDLVVRSGALQKALWDDSAGRWTFTGLMTITGSVVFGGDLIASLANGAKVFSGGSANNVGGNIQMFGQSHASQANDVELRAGTTPKLAYDDSAGQWSVPSGVDFAFGEMIITEHAANQPRITWDTDDYQRYIQTSNQMQYVLGNVARWTWNQTEIAPAVDGGYDLGTSSLHFGTTFSQRFEVDANFHAERWTPKLRQVAKVDCLMIRTIHDDEA